MTDTTILSTTAASHRKNAAAVMKRAADVKIEHYADAVKLEGALFLPLVMEAMGGCTVIPNSVFIH